MPGINIIQQPKNFSPLYNPNNVVVDETGSLFLTEDFFQYVLRVSINNSPQITLKSVPDLNTQYGVFNLGDILRNYADEVFNTTDATFIASQSVIEVDFDFGWEYESGSQFIEVSESVANSRKFFNGGLELSEYILFESRSDNPYLITTTGAVSGKALQTQLTSSTKDSTKQWLYYLSETPSSVKYVQLATYDRLGTQLGEYRFGVGGFSGSIASNNCLGVQVGKSFLEDLSPARVTGVDPIFSNGGESYYEVWLESDSNDIVTDKHRYEIQNTCSPWDLYNVYYLNALGGISSFPFHGKIIEDTTVDRDTYKKQRYDLTSDGLQYDRTKGIQKSYFTTYRERLQLSTEFYSQQRINELKDLKLSPAVLIEFPNGDITAGVVEDNSFRKANRNNNEVMALRLEVLIDENNIRQNT